MKVAIFVAEHNVRFERRASSRNGNPCEDNQDNYENQDSQAIEPRAISGRILLSFIGIGFNDKTGSLKTARSVREMRLLQVLLTLLKIVRP